MSGKPIHLAVLLGTLLPGPVARAQAESPPFLDLETDARPPEAAVREEPWITEGVPQLQRVVAGHGQPLCLRLGCRPGEAARLSYRDAARVVRLDVSGQEQVELRPRQAASSCLLESLHPVPGRPGAWVSRFREFRALVRGLLPFAGGADAGEPGSDGSGGLFREPAGLAVVGGDLHHPERWIAADPGRHRILRLDRDGRPEAAWGLAGEPGHRDGGPDQARFRAPGGVAGDTCNPAPGPWRYCSGFLVADSGNHVIRRVDAAGRVTTLAGTPGEAGHRDADQPLQAAFKDPQGLAMDLHCAIYVADRGNRVIRRIGPDGIVTTLAGRPGDPGDRDGTGPQARFTAPRGLALGADGRIYVLDGHALRRISRAGEVATVLGRVDQPGFRDLPAGQGPGPAGVPCLREPAALAPARGLLLIADTGNHAVRAFDPATGALTTLAGDPDRRGIRWGLLRDGLEGPLEEGYGTLDAPAGIAAGQCGEIVVATGDRLVQLARQHLPDPPMRAELRPERPRAAVAEPLRADFQVSTAGTRGQGGRPIRYTVDFLNADGTLAERRAGAGTGERLLSETGRFTRPGRGRIRLRCVTDQGCSAGARAAVEVR